MDNIMKTQTKHSIVIVVNDKKFLFDAKQLTDNSTYFEKTLNGSFKEAQQKEIVLNDVDLEEFQFFRDWIFGIRTSFKGLDRDFLIRLILLADRFMLNQFRLECHKIIKFWLDKDISFPCRALEAAKFIGDEQLKDMVTHWLRGKLETPFGKNSLKEIQDSTKAMAKFMTNNYGKLTANASEEVMDEIKKTIVDHYVAVTTKTAQIRVLYNQLEARMAVLRRQVEQFRANGDMDRAMEIAELMSKESKEITEKIKQIG